MMLPKSGLSAVWTFGLLVVKYVLENGHVYMMPIL
jgi:hypothetical protein